MRFHIIESNDYCRHLSWIGKYTYGTCMIRGISINLFSEYGKIWSPDLKYGDNFIIDEPDKLTYVLNDDDTVNFRYDSHAFRISDFDEFEKHLNSFRKYNRNEKISYYYRPWDGCDDILYSLESKIVYSLEANMCLDLKISKDELISEIKEIQEFCIKNDITCQWV